MQAGGGVRKEASARRRIEVSETGACKPSCQTALVQHLEGLEAAFSGTEQAGGCVKVLGAPFLRH